MLYQARVYLVKFADALARLDESYRSDQTPYIWKEFHGRF
jgi:hypothetical protein